MMKICLVLCPSWGIETPPLGIALLSASLRRRGFEVEVRDLNIIVQNRHKEKGLWKSEEDVHWENEDSIARFIEEHDGLLESFAEEITAAQPRIVGLSVYNTTCRLSLELAKRIKRKDKDIIIVLGGQHCFPAPSAAWLIQHEAVDAVVRGEGEEVFPELAGKIEKLKRVDFCPGIVYKDRGKVVDCGARPPITAIDRIPFPDFSDFALGEYDNPRQLPILSSRGCPYPCVFCSTKLFWIRFRSMSGERIFREMEHQLNRHESVEFFTFNDHVVNGDMNVLSALCDMIIRAKADNPRWGGLRWRGAAVVRSEMDAGFMRKMKEAGCIELEYGIESASLKVRKAMRKPPYDVKTLEHVIRDTHTAGIGARVNFMFGFPGETEADFEETLGFLKRNREYFDQVHPSETFCCIDPGTYLFDHPEEFGVTGHTHSLFWSADEGRNVYPERLRRHQIFCKLATEYGIPLSPGGHKIMLHKEQFLAEYERYKDSRGAQKT